MVGSPSTFKSIWKWVLEHKLRTVGCLWLSGIGGSIAYSWSQPNMKPRVKLIDASRYYTGYPKDIGPSRVINFTSERQFVQLLHEGHPVVVAFTIRCSYTKHLDRVLEEAAAEFHPHIKFMRVECPKYPGFCIARQRKDYPFIEIFHSPEQAANQGKVVDPNIKKYSVKVLPFNYDASAYGFREFFKRHGMHPSETN